MSLPFTLSGLGRAIECPAHLVLPHTRTVSKYASRGSVVHQFLEHIRSMSVADALKLAPDEDRPALEALDLENPALALEPSAYAAEVAFAVDVETGEARELGRGQSRDYSGAREGEVCGTADLVGVTEDAVIIIDYKTGFADLGPLWMNWQLRAYALAACRAYGKKRAILIIVRIKPNGDAYQTPPAVLTELDLELTAAEISLLVGRVEKLRGVKWFDLPTSEGPWCGYCPAKDRCPSKTMYLRVASGEQLERLVELATADVEPLVWRNAVDAVERHIKVGKRAKEVLDERAAEGLFELGNGEIYGPQKQGKRWVDPVKGRDVLLRRFGPVAEQQIETKLSIAGLEKLIYALPKEGERKSFKARFAEVFEELEAAGAAGTNYTYPVTRYKPKE